MIEKKYVPDFVVVHKDYEKEKLLESFYKPIENLCENSSIELLKTSSISELQKDSEGNDLGICVGFMEIIKKDIFKIPKYGILNLHCGKLPKYRGRAPISRTIMNGERYLIISVHKIDEGVDSGDILNETEILIDDNGDVNSLYKKCSEKSAESIIESIEKIESGNPIFLKQDISPDSKPNKKISYEERRINWDNDINKIRNLIRALVPPYPCACSVLDGEEYNFLASEIDSHTNDKNWENGQIMNIENNSMLINCSNGIIKINKISDRNSEIIVMKEKFKIGDIFI
ncbi:methionyl-tRNA formyltransferase [Bacteroidota bacterium]